jgi:hypothetical protein
VSQEFQISPGQTVQVADTGLRITFQEVPDDSRCPVDVTCVWAGDATVMLSVVKPPRPAATLALHASGGAQNEAVYEGYRVKLMGLAPKPRSTSTIPQDAYRAGIVVDTAG